MTHTVGDGAKVGTQTTHRQWFALWGLAPLNAKDSQELAGGATDYRVTTQWSFIDVVINIFTGYVTLYCQTITVEK